MLKYKKNPSYLMAGKFTECQSCKSENLMNTGGCPTCLDCGWSACPVA